MDKNLFLWDAGNKRIPKFPCTHLSTTAYAPCVVLCVSSHHLHECHKNDSNPHNQIAKLSLALISPCELKLSASVVNAERHLHCLALSKNCEYPKQCPLVYLLTCLSREPCAASLLSFRCHIPYVQGLPPPQSAAEPRC